MKDAILGFPGRAKAVRESHQLTQDKFVPVVNEAAQRVLGAGVRVYSQSTYSRLESGRQPPSLEDVLVLAACDKALRGILWLGWELTEDITTEAVKPEKARQGKGTIIAGTGAPAAKKNNRAG